MPIPIQGFLFSLLAFMVSMTIYPATRRFALHHGILDNPDARKLQRVPVPVLGGAVVFVSYYFCVMIFLALHGEPHMFAPLLSMAVMTGIGIWDDLRGLPAAFRFVVEMVVVWVMMGLGGDYINDFHGLWGLGELSKWISAPLSILAGVGIINAINLIDGVDGYCSGFGILGCLLFSIPMAAVGAWVPACTLWMLAAALLPFWLHNVFGKRSKMFLGDGGSLLLGTGFVAMVFFVLSHKSPCTPLAEEKGMGLIPFTLAVMAIPVFDTVRVMTMRMIRGRSPFDPDKTHLHHLFIELGFSHVATSLNILLMNLAIVLIWCLSWMLGASVDLQLYIVVALGLLVTFAFYKFIKIHQERQSRYYAWMCQLGKRSHRFMLGAWVAVRNVVDKPIPRIQRLQASIRRLFKK